MPTLTTYDAKNPDPFLDEARAQIVEAKKRGQMAWLNLGGAMFWFVLWCFGIWPWPTFVLSVYLLVLATFAFEASWNARSSATIALSFRTGIER